MLTHGRSHPKLPWDGRRRPSPIPAPSPWTAASRKRKKLRGETLDQSSGSSPRGSRTVSRAGFEHGGDADPGSIDTDAMTTLTSSLLRTGAAGKGAARRSPPALLEPAVGLGALGLWGWGLWGSGALGALGLGSLGLLPAPQSCPAPLQPHSPGRDCVTATAHGVPVGQVCHTPHTHDAATEPRIAGCWMLSPAPFGLLLLCQSVFSLAGWNQDLTVEAHNGATQFFSITGESSSLQVYF